jgi:hypothetical protein
MRQFITFEYRAHKCVVYKQGKYWDADITPPNGLGSNYLVSPFESRFIGRTIKKVIQEVDHYIEFENEQYEFYLAVYDSPPPPKIHS